MPLVLALIAWAFGASTGWVIFWVFVGVVIAHQKYMPSN